MATSIATTPLPGGTLEVRVHTRKGRSLHTTKLVKAGETVLVEAPLLLLVSPEMAHSTCSACLRAVGPQQSLSCSGCRQACFCSTACQQAAQSTPWMHSAPICSAYARLAALGLPAEEQAQLRFLLHAVALRHTQTAQAAARYAGLLDLVGEPTEEDRALAARFVPLLSEALAGAGPAGALVMDAGELAALLRKEQLNSYGVLAAPQQAVAARVADAAAATAAAAQRGGRCAGGGVDAAAGPGSGPSSACGGGCVPAGGAAADEAGGDEEEEERRLRGSAMYSQASLINHECLPNVARFDFFDSAATTCTGAASASTSTPAAPAATLLTPTPDAAAPTITTSTASSSGNTTHVVFRALHDLPPGTELAQSYVPLHWGLADRQAQCREVYGFACTCPRCQTESQWSDDEDSDSEWESEEEEGDGMAEDAADGAEAADGGGGGDDGEVEMEDVTGPITAPPGEEGPLEPNYLRLFLLKYMCPRPGCHGTAAPPTPGSLLLECNVCGQSRSEQAFLRELERTQREERRAAAAKAKAKGIVTTAAAAAKKR